MEQPSLFKNIPPIVEKKKKDNYSLGPKTNPAKYEYSYSKYIQSYEWREKAKRAKKLFGNKCKRCGATENLSVHHVDYSTLYNETIYDIEVLCNQCHRIADKDREIETGFRTWLEKRYGEIAEEYYDDEILYEEFRDWIYDSVD
ncbi:MAG: hypothetical protein SD837_10110 [Candidatus Electrothrix scaldis]|nr:MAG: hypothetical protein SD837_10110 [Candidatus Electrothrix sp. GW3-3]